MEQGKGITRWFPYEIITQIMEATPRADQASLCRVSSMFHDLCVPLLYSVVQICHRHNALAFYSALVENPKVLESIRSCSFFSTGPMTSNILLQSINLMPRLEHLTTHDDRVLQTCTVPSLISCRIGLKRPVPEANIIASFLTRHPALARVRVDIVSRFQPPSVPISLPNLQRFDGPACFIPLMLSRGLAEARLRWHPGETYSNTDIDRIFAALHSLTSPEIPFFSSYEYYNDLGIPIVTAASIHLPHTRTLRVRNATPWTLNDLGIIRHITTCLPRFAAVVYLAVNFDDGSLGISAERATVEAWTEAFLTLEAYCLSGFPFNCCLRC
ncbi:hypothetical protein B0H17DRAFT_1081525 [Mycena rosella]|uniref:F-box domain-containing protein n=1 Tax=Mycena rosella TaxID=1033263 RepID=A0AAD7D1U6_MYCRO|nr:hypothetical protein B0H17DRAFT_1081525 [Mycena rosella]